MILAAPGVGHDGHGHGPNRFGVPAAALRLHADTTLSGWDPKRAVREPSTGAWRIFVDAPAPGSYRYKFLVDGERWIEDPASGARVPDPYGGFDSVLRIES